MPVQYKETIRTAGARIINLPDLKRLRYSLPESWDNAAGMLRHKRVALERHLKRVRSEWNRTGNEL